MVIGRMSYKHRRMWAGILGAVLLLAAFLAALLLTPVISQARTVGLFLNESRASEGYTLFAPMRSSTTFLIDNQGREVHSWKSSHQTGTSVYLLDTGLLLRTCRAPGPTVFDAGGAGGRIELLDWDGSVLWEFEYADEIHLAHHDVKYLPNGNILLIAWEWVSREEALAAGRNPELLADGELWPDTVIEVDPFGEIVWKWRVMDHLVQDYDPSLPNHGDPAANPRLIDANHTGATSGADWTHINSIDYNPDLDQIILSVHGFNEVWIIDHSTTTDQAAGHTGGDFGRGGDLLYRWGNPAAYGAGTAADKKLFGQHDAQWIASGSPGEGDILIFNNGLTRPQGKYSTVDQVALPTDGAGGYYLEDGAAYGPEDASWIYRAVPPSSFYAQNISGVQRLPNGNTLVCEGTSGTFFEITDQGELVWKYVNPVTGQGALGVDETIPGSNGNLENSVFKIRRYEPDYPGLDGQDLTPGEVIER